METLNNNNNSDNSEIKLLANRLDIHRYSEVPKYYVQPQESRPDKVMVKNDSIPIINLGGHDRAHIINQLLKASQEYGLFQLMTNGKVVGGIHRAVTNSKTARTSVVYLIYPSPKAIIKPAEEFVNEKTPTLGKFMNFEDFHAYYVKNGMKIEEEYFKIKP
ncbi:hypothetical protein HN51_060189 [Arachis hypogaea]|uniref:uncharacterized protein LOC112784495 n=1 Tax=Arachis hypogaea TaxID=3818 RepID=UPI000DEDAC67|nr:uncharacterized protein LOC112784495 [Arachis hypogaea]